MDQEPLTLLCLAHMNWDHVWQRPQQIMSRFTSRCRVIYVDPPEVVEGTGEPSLQEREGHGGVRVLRPRFPQETMNAPGNSYESLWLSLLPKLLDEAGTNTILWVYTPLADYLVEAVQTRIRLAVYDCMDDLASFKGATHEREREEHLLGLADLVFTGGSSMYEARKDRHPRVHCFPSGVDVAHYRKVHDPETVVPWPVSDMPRPRLGYFGVLDERIDWDLIAELAAQRPDWQWVLVGPVVKVDPADLPSAPNIHYLGHQAYTDLPGFLKGFDIATMPFALNQHTRFISPTKTLEYLAGGKPVISSSVPDVVAFYQDIVYICDGPGAWLMTLGQMLAAPETEREERLRRAAPILEQSSWDSIAERMWTLMEEQFGAREATA